MDGLQTHTSRLTARRSGARALLGLGLAASTALAACGRAGDQRAATDEALRNDLSLATQAQQYRPQQFVSPQELGANPYGAPNQYGQAPYGLQPNQAGYAAGPYMAAAPAPVRERVVYRDRPTSTRRSSSGGGYRVASGGGYSAAEAARAAEEQRAIDRRRTRARQRQQGAITGAVAGAAIGAVTSGRGDRVKGAVLGGAAGGLLGAVIGNNRSRP